MVTESTDNVQLIHTLASGTLISVRVEESPANRHNS